MGVSTSTRGTIGTEGFVNGVYEHALDDVVRIAAIPAWNETDVNSGGAWLNAVPVGGLTGFRQTLDMYDGVLTTSYDWREHGRTVHIKVETFVSRADAEIGAVRVEVTPASDGELRLRMPLRVFPPPHRYPLGRLEKLEGEAAKNQQAIWYPGHMAAREQRVNLDIHESQAVIALLAEAEGTGAQVAEAAALAWPRQFKAAKIDRLEREGSPGIEIAFRARAGQTYRFDRIAAILPAFTGREELALAIAKARGAARAGYESLATANAAAWHELWRSDIVVEGDPALQKTIHSMLFYLLGSARAGSEFSIPPMGLSTAGYYGHIFWDADTYMFPPLLLLHPNLARSMIMFRCRTLDAARENAKRNGYRGAMYPWEAGPDGAETTPRFAYQNALYENHVNGDVALAAWQYYLATGDRAWLERFGYPVIHDTADFWTSRVTYDRITDRYNIGNVVSVVESQIGINDDPYTNAVARKNLELATAAAKLLGRTPDPKWEEVARQLHMPSMESMLIDYPLELPMTPDWRRAIARKAAAEPARGAMMGVEFYPILGVELHDRKLIDTLLPRTWRPYVRAPFQVLPETPTNDNINFITGAGAFLQQFLFGYSGQRLGPRGLEKRYSPLLPSSVRKMILKGVTVRGERRDIAVVNGKVE